MSSLIAMFLGQQRHLIRISTPVATEPLHLTPIIRDVSKTRLTSEWVSVDYPHLSEMIANTSKELYTREHTLQVDKKQEKAISSDSKEVKEGGKKEEGREREGDFERY